MTAFHSQKFASDKPKRPVMDYNEDAYDGWIDSVAFATYCVKVKEAIYAADKPLWIAHVNQAMGEDCNRAWTIEALRALCSLETIREVPMILPTRYEPSEQRPEVIRRFNNQDPLYRENAIRPDRESFV